MKIAFSVINYENRIPLHARGVSEWRVYLESRSNLEITGNFTLGIH